MRQIRRKIVFLDIDGVLQPLEAQERFKNIIRDDNRNACRPEVYEYLEHHFNIDYRQYHPYDVAAVYYDWDKTAVALLKTVLEYSNAKIVLSSDWRLDRGGFDRMKAFFAMYGLDKYFIDMTSTYNVIDETFKEQVESDFKEQNHKNPDLSYRSVEILEWLNRNPDVKNWVAIDDLRLNGLGNHFVMTKSSMKDEHAVKCLKILR